MQENVALAVREQIVAEIESSYLYLQMAAWFDAMRLPGFAAWLRGYSHNAVSCALMLFNHLDDRGEKVPLAGVRRDRAVFASVPEAVALLLRRSRDISVKIHEILDLAAAAEDKEACLLLTWFAAAQLEEASTVVAVMERVTACPGEDGTEMEVLDNEMSRAYSEASAQKRAANLYRDTVK